MDYPYLAYLDMQNALRNGCQARADSLAGRMCCVARGASDTTFYILAVYFVFMK